MKRLGTAAALALCGWAAWAEMRDEEYLVADRTVLIRVVDTQEIMTVGLNADDQSQVLSGADIEVLATTGDPDSLALVGQAVVVTRVFGSHSCETGDAWLYHVVTLGSPAMTEGPVSSCAELTVSFTPGAVVLEQDPGSGAGEFWAWRPGRGFSDRLE
ncbi:MAG TPA: hypothetical protein PLM52_16120 [Tabrizicola sp.]|nr:hypothetical protein [Tabrizicola sp.]